MSVAQEWRRVEEQICADVPAPLTHTPDSDGRTGADWYDAELDSPYLGSADLPLRGRTAAPAGCKVEIKTTTTYTSNGDRRRRGRITIHEQNHRDLVAARGLYCIALRDASVAVLVDAGYLDVQLAGSWTSGDGTGRGRSAQLAWPHVISTATVEGGGR